MCILCTEWQLGNLTLDEAWRNLNEMIDDESNTQEELDHLYEIGEEIADQKLAQLGFGKKNEKP